MDLALRSGKIWLSDCGITVMQKPLYRIERILMYAYCCQEIPAPNGTNEQTDRQNPESPAARSQEK